MATGRGAKPIAGISSYCVGNLRIPGYPLPWEEDWEYASNLATPLEIEVKKNVTSHKLQGGGLLEKIMWRREARRGRGLLIVPLTLREEECVCNTPPTLQLLSKLRGRTVVYFVILSLNIYAVGLKSFM